MTDRVRSLTVTLDKEYRVDDVEAIVNAIKMTRGVATVENGPVVSGQDHLNRQAIIIDVLPYISQFAHLALRGGEQWDQIRQALDDFQKDFRYG
jgi:hypothetical protein